MVGMLRLNAVGPEVTRLQRALAQSGSRLSVDGHFGHATEAAVRLFQRKHALLPDGIAGHATLRVLVPAGSGSPPVPAAPASSGSAGQAPSMVDIGRALAALAESVGPSVLPCAIAALHRLAEMSTSRPPRTMSMSDAGVAFLFSLEAQANVSNHLYWPTGSSGVTLGAGYDMKARDAATIKADMLAIGLTAQAAETASQGAGKTLTDADAFAKKNRSAISLTPAQETALLKLILPIYEAIVKNNVTVNLLQHEFDALVSFAYNPGGKFTEVSKLINGGEVAKAMVVMKKRVYSAGKVFPALVRRRNDEVNVYLYGNYART